MKRMRLNLNQMIRTATSTNFFVGVGFAITHSAASNGAITTSETTIGSS